MVEIPVEIISSGYSYNCQYTATARHALVMTDSCVGVDRLTVDVEVVLSQNLGALVDGATRTVEDTAKHVLGHTELERVAAELDFGLLHISTTVWTLFG